MQALFDQGTPAPLRQFLLNHQVSTAYERGRRARPGLGISVPVEWSELPSLRGGDHWTMRSAQTRLDKCNDSWAGYAKAAKSLTSTMKTLGLKP